MSGLIATIGRLPEPRDLDTMTRAIAHRGQIAQTYRSHEVAIAHLHRPTTREARNEPHAVAAPDGLVAAADARLDNRSELIRQLEDAKPASTDLDLLLAAYRRWGERCAAHLLGDFAYVIWDPKRAALVGARDHFGARPLYWARSEDGSICVASESAALSAHPSVDQRLDQDYLGAMLGLRRNVAGTANCAFVGVQRVPPATSFVASAEGMRLTSYWSVEDAPRLDLAANDAVEGFLEVFEAAVESRLRTDGRVASHLSGGLDSSAVTAVATQANPNVMAITNSFPDVPDCDETFFAKQVVEHLGISDHHVFRADQRGPLDVLEDVLPLLNEPYIGSNHHLVWGLTSAAAQRGATVVLDGFDGDSVISHGYGRLRELGAAGSWADLAVEAAALANHRGTDAATAIKSAGAPAIERLLRQGRWVRAAKGTRSLSRSPEVSGTRLALSSARRAWLGRRQAAATHDVVDARSEHIAGLNPAGMARTLEWLDLYANHHGLEARHPFIDKRVVEFCVGLPAVHKLSHGYDRWVARQAMEGLLPRPVQWRTDKTDMNVNFLRGLLSLDRDRLDRALESELAELDHLIDVDDFVQRVRPALLGDDPKLRPADALQVWRVVSTAHVLRSRWPGQATG